MQVRVSKFVLEVENVRVEAPEGFDAQLEATNYKDEKEHTEYWLNVNVRLTKEQHEEIARMRRLTPHGS